MAAKGVTFDELMKSIKNRDFKPVYLLMGEESYFIDRISDMIEENMLTSEEKEFNQTVMYGADVEIGTVINAAKRYPMMSEHQVIIVKEAQNIKNLDGLSFYLQKPMRSTILVLCYKNGKADRRKKYVTEIEKIGVVFESAKMKDDQLPGFISTFLKKKGIDIDSNAALILSEHVGSNLTRIVGELDKLCILLPKGQTRVTPQQIEENIGISKEYNNFELKNALINNDVLKANRIINYFCSNSKANPIQMTLALLFGFYSNLMLTYYAPQKTEEGIASFLGFRTSWQAKEYLIAMKKYSAKKVMEIITEIRYCDARSKGVGNSMADSGDLLKELIYKILH